MRKLRQHTNAILDRLRGKLRSGQEAAFKSQCGTLFQGQGDRCINCRVPYSAHVVLEALALIEEATAVAAVDPHAGSTGKPTTRVKRTNTR